MKKFLPALLIFLALGLCGLVTFQWIREARLRDQIKALSETVTKRNGTIRDLEGNLRNAKSEIERLEGVKTQLTETIKTNRQEIADLTKYGEKLERDLEASKQQVEAYRDALAKANENIKQQNDTIKRQNADLKQLAEERNASVVKYNGMVEQYNDLVKQFNKMQDDYQKALNPTSAPPAPSNKKP